MIHFQTIIPICPSNNIINEMRLILKKIPMEWLRDIRRRQSTPLFVHFSPSSQTIYVYRHTQICFYEFLYCVHV